MAHAICERCMLVKRYPLKHETLLIYLACFITCAFHTNMYSRAIVRDFWRTTWFEMKSMCLYCISSLLFCMEGFMSHAYKYCWERSVCIPWCLQLVSGSQYSITHLIVFLCWRNTFISRSWENTAKARTSLASACRMDTLFSGDSAL